MYAIRTITELYIQKNTTQGVVFFGIVFPVYIEPCEYIYILLTYIYIYICIHINPEARSHLVCPALRNIKPQSAACSEKGKGKSGADKGKKDKKGSDTDGSGGKKPKSSEKPKASKSKSKKAKKD